jgi:hypothetical protein
MSKLKPEILNNLSKQLGLSKNSVRQYISRERTSHPRATLNAAAQLFALKNKKTVLRMLGEEDKKTLPDVEIEKERITVKQKMNIKKEKVKIFIDYQTADHFKSGHIDEINRAYTHNCYTAVFILTRKIIENLIIGILIKKFPKNRCLYWDDVKKRYLDFSVVLGNLLKMKNDFGTNVSAVDRFHQLAKPFKSDANDKTHSLFHLVKNKKELDDIGIKDIVELIGVLEKEVGLR